MTRAARLVWVVLLSPALGNLAAKADEAPPAGRWLPPDTLLTLELEHPQPLLDLLTGPKFTRMITSQPAYGPVMESPKFRGLVQLVRYLELQTGNEWRKGLSTLVQGGAALAVLPGDRAVLIADSGDPALLKHVHDLFVQGARGEAAKQGGPDPVASRDVQGATVWTLGGAPCYALIGGRFVWGNTPKALETVLEHRAHPDRPCLEKSAAYQAALEAAGTKAAAVAFADMTVLKRTPKFAKALGPAENPLAVLLAGGMTDALRKATWLGMGLGVEGERLELTAATDGGATGAADRPGFGVPPEKKGALPVLEVPRRIAGLSAYRDLFAFYLAKDELFPERTSGLIFFENMMGIFFSGRDLTTEVFAETRPEVRFVVAEQSYDPAVGTPEVKLPAFALVVPTRHPDEFARVVEEAWQKGVGLVSVTRGQQAEPGMVIDRLMHGDVKFTVVTNSVGKHEDRAHLPSRFNYSPSLARVGDTFVLSSTEGLARDLIDALGKKAPASASAPTGMHTVAEIDGARLVSVLNANRSTIIERNMVEKANTRQQAEAEFDTLAGLVRLAKHARIAGAESGGLSRYTLEIDLNLP